MSRIRVKVLIDKEQKRAVCAEAGSDFVDVLFSFLALPLGSIVRLLGKKSGLGSLDCLYESVEQLDVKHLQTEACQEMLLKPRSAAAGICEDLKIQHIHDANPRAFYICNESACFLRSTCYYTYVTKARCTLCDTPMTKSWLRPKKESDEGGIFVNETTDFMITDDLRVMPTSFKDGCSLLNQLQVTDASALEEMIIDFGTEEALNLLSRSLVSKNPLTEICFPGVYAQASANNSSAIKEEIDVNEEESEITLKLVLNKKHNTVLYTEAGEHFVNQLLSFLTFPLGSEITSQKLSVPRCCANCHNDKGMPSRCYHLPCYERQSELVEQNSKVEKIVTAIGGFYVADSRRFMITDNLHISSLSFVSAIANEMNFSISDLVVKDVCLDKAKVLSLLSAMLISKTVFTDAFCPKPKRSKIN